eukprot:c13618_g1_i1 orf=2-241(-)
MLSKIRKEKKGIFSANNLGISFCRLRPCWLSSMLNKPCRRRAASSSSGEFLFCKDLKSGKDNHHSYIVIFDYITFSLSLS